MRGSFWATLTLSLSLKGEGTMTVGAQKETVSLPVIPAQAGIQWHKTLRESNPPGNVRAGFSLLDDVTERRRNDGP
jgi:hypothetical protein